MKKKILGAAIIAVMALAISWNFNQSKNEVELSDLALANVEALANGENISGKICFYQGTTNYDEFIPCDAKYPDIGKCKERVLDHYSKDQAQCYE